MPSLQADLQQLLTESYLDGVDSKSLEEIRAMRGACQEAEAALSFLRRVAQGRLDIVHACLDHLRDEVAPDLATLVGELPDILSGGPSRPPGPGRLPLFLAPDLEMTGLTEDIDAVLSAESIGHLGERTADELQAAATALEAIERQMSSDRHALHARIDRLQAELVSRYKAGRATVDGLLT